MKRALVLIVGLDLALGACASTDQRELSLPERGVVARLSAYVRLFQYDYEPASTPAGLASQADAVITGAIVAVTPGQSYAPTSDSKPVIATSVLEVKVDQLVVGDAGLVADGSVYIEVAHSAFVGTGTEDGEVIPFDLSAFAETVPRAYGVFFLDDRTVDPYWDVIIDQGAGRPSGARITSTLVQGFLIEDVNGRLVSVSEPLELMPPAWHGLQSVEEVVALISVPTP